MNAAAGIVAGAAGAVALAALDRVEAALLGRPAVYAPARIARRLARARLGARLPSPAARRAGVALRTGYAVALGVAYGAAREAAPRVRSARAAICFGGAIALAERLALPRAGATPPLRRWTAAERALLVPHAVAFAATAELALSSLRRRRPARRRP